MILNNVPEIKITSNNHEQNLYSVIPNFLFVNQPEVKALETKIKRNKRMIVWFDIRNEHDRNKNFRHSTAVLKNFNFQLTLKTYKGYYQLKPINGKEVTNLESLTISYDQDGLMIDKNIFVYELSEEKLKDEITFEYSISYNNDQRYGLTINGIKGTNRGAIVIKNGSLFNNNEVILNNAFAYLNNKVVILNRDILKINKNKINPFSSVDKPLFTVSVQNEIDSVPEITKSSQIRAELSKLVDTGVNYLQIDKTTLKTVKKDNSYHVYQVSGNHYDFQTNKWIKGDQDKTYYFDEDKLKLSFEYNYQKFDLNLDVNNFDFKIKRIRSVNKKLTIVSSYKNVKPNTKFNTFINSRSSK